MCALYLTPKLFTRAVSIRCLVVAKYCIGKPVYRSAFLQSQPGACGARATEARSPTPCPGRLRVHRSSEDLFCVAVVVPSLLDHRSYSCKELIIASVCNLVVGNLRQKAIKQKLLLHVFGAVSAIWLPLLPRRSL